MKVNYYTCAAVPLSPVAPVEAKIYKYVYARVYYLYMRAGLYKNK